MKIGYARISLENKNKEHVISTLKNAGCEQIYIDKIMNVKDIRCELNNAINALKENDILVVPKIVRFAISIKDFKTLLKRIDEKNADFESLKEPYMNTSLPNGKNLLLISEAFANFQNEIRACNIHDGFISNLNNKGGRPAVDSEMIKLAISLHYSNEYTMKQITEKTGITKSTFYKYLNKKQSNTLE